MGRSRDYAYNNNMTAIKFDIYKNLCMKRFYENEQ